MSSPGRGRGSPRRQPPGQGPPPHGQQQQQTPSAAQRMGGYMPPHQPYAAQPQLPHGSQQQQYPYPVRNYPQHLQQPPGQQPAPFPYYQGQPQHNAPLPSQQSPYRGPPAAMQHMQPSPARNPYSMPLPPAGSVGAAGIVGSGMSGMEMPSSYIQPRPGRLPKDRPIVKLSVSLIDTYKEINRVSLWTVLMTAFVSVDFGLV